MPITEQLHAELVSLYDKWMDTCHDTRFKDLKEKNPQFFKDWPEFDARALYTFSCEQVPVKIAEFLLAGELTSAEFIDWVNENVKAHIRYTFVRSVYADALHFDDKHGLRQKGWYKPLLDGEIQARLRQYGHSI